jgi:hypothetical protein
MSKAGSVFAEGWDVWHVPGFSRAWRREFPDGHSVLVTGIDGFDLPDDGGPYAALYLSPHDDCVEHDDYLAEPRHLVRWLGRMDRINSRT